jgi:hypothetical protein
MTLKRKISILAVSAAMLVGAFAAESAPAWAAAPVVETKPPTFVKRARATLNGTVTPEGAETVYFYEYGTSACDAVTGTCGAKTPTRGPVTEPVTAEPLKVAVTPGVTYHYWIVAANAEGTAHGTEETFTTSLIIPKEYRFLKHLEGYTFQGPLGVGVYQATGDVYATDKEASPPKIEQFDAAGKVQSGLEIAPSGDFNQVSVDNSTSVLDPSRGDVYIADVTGGVVYRFDRADGTDPSDEGSLVHDSTPTVGGGTLGEAIGVAVDPSGNVYVANLGAGTVSKLSPTGQIINANFITGLVAPIALAIDGDGNIYVASVMGTFEYALAGTCAEPEPGVTPESCKPINSQLDFGVAADSAGDVFVSEYEIGTVGEYGPGPGRTSIKNVELENAFGGPYGLAIDNASQTLYVAEEGGRRDVNVFKFVEAKQAVVQTEPAAPVNGESGSLNESLNGTVNPGGVEPAEYYFEYGTAPCDVAAGTCGAVATEQGQLPLVGEATIPVSVRLEGLAPNTTYHYWAVAVNEEAGVSHGEERTFTTGSPTPPPAGPPSEGSAPTSSTPTSSPIYPLLTSIVPVPGPKPVVKKTLTRAQLLTKALATCNRKPRKQRAACKRQARRKYGPVSKGVAKKRRK